ncbi:MAG TPA: alpha-L-fucosidase [Thermomicrobiales bacterium]|nr:alpha-L-fucosidase [Thermomicrobiales bacterium]
MTILDATSIARPTPSQLAYQRERSFALFFHFGINTFYGKEWSDGTLDPAGFDPTDLDSRQWVDIAKRAGAAHVILTAKHHDGFCLWPSGTTDYSVKSSPWRGGRGDVVGELADACRDAGIGLGLYLSPWDRHERSWAEDQPAYDRFYLRQLEELMTNYGPLVEVWFDGAGSEQHPYDWGAITAVVDRHQPDALVFNMGRPAIRWVGNEDGLAADPCWYTVDETAKSAYTDDREGLPGGGWYLPPECDVAIRRHWFWQDDDLQTLKSINHLEAIWYRSVGLGANLLLNVPPDRRGLIDDRDAERLLEFAGTIRDRFANPVPAMLVQDGRSIVAIFPEATTFDHLILREAIEDGQRIGSHRIVGTATGAGIVTGVFTVGSQRVHAFPAVTTASVTIEIDDPLGQLVSVDAFHTGVEALPALEDQPRFMSEKVDPKI